VIDALPQLIASALVLGGIYALASVGLTLIFGVMRIVNFAHGEFLMMSMYLAIGLSLLGLDPYVGLVIGIPISLVFGFVIYQLTISPVIGRPHVVQIFTTLGISIFLQNLALLLFSGDFRQLNLSYGDTVVKIGGAFVTVPQLIAFCVATVFTLALFAWLRFSYLGRATRATAQDRSAATLMGIDTKRIFLVCFLIGTVCVYVAGTLMAPLFPTYPTAGLHFVMVAFVVVVLGGLGSTIGALAGGMIVAFLDTFGGFMIGAAWKEVLYFIVFMAVLLVRPAGLFGQRGAEEL
jgi:branched-chain amino acid transport system permease protein